MVKNQHVKLSTGYRMLKVCCPACRAWWVSYYSTPRLTPNKARRGAGCIFRMLHSSPCIRYRTFKNVFCASDSQSLYMHYMCPHFVFSALQMSEVLSNALFMFFIQRRFFFFINTLNFILWCRQAKKLLNSRVQETEQRSNIKWDLIAGEHQQKPTQLFLYLFPHYVSTHTKPTVTIFWMKDANRQSGCFHLLQP